MRKLNKFFVAMLLASAVSSVNAASAKLYEDVPTNHWAYKAVADLSEKGLLIGMPNGTFCGNKPMTRYTFAVVVNRMLERYDQMMTNGNNVVTKKDLRALEDLVGEFVNEIESLSEDIKEVDGKVTKLDEKVNTLATKTDEIGKKQDQLEKNVGKVKVNGSILVHGVNVKKTGTDYKDDSAMTVRVGFKAHPTDKVEADFQYVAYENSLNSSVNSTESFRYGAKPSLSTNKVEVANVKIKDINSNGDSIQIGRRFMTHGQGIVLNDYADAVTYNRKAGDVNIQGNVIFEDKPVVGASGEINTKKNHQIWNLNADVNVKGHNIYSGIYHTTYPANVYADVPSKDGKSTIFEVGSSGKIKKEGKVKYDVALVGTTISRTNINNGNRKDEATGYLEHVALTWTPTDKLALKTAYTTADKNYSGAISLDREQEAVDGPVTPFDDIAKFANLFGGIAGNDFRNTSDLKLQFEYFFANKQSIRFAYDIVKENKNIVKNGFTPDGLNCDYWNIAGYNKLDSKVSTLEYKYQFDPSTRFSLGYTGADNSKCRDRYDNKVSNEKIIWTELYSKF